MNRVIIFTSPTCAPCKALKPLLLELLGAEKVEIVEAGPTTAARFARAGVRSVPTVICEDEVGAEAGRFTGAQNRDQLTATLTGWGLL